MEVLPLFSELIVFLKINVVNLSLLAMSWIFFFTHQRCQADAHSGRRSQAVSDLFGTCLNSKVLATQRRE